ncbi:MAG: hypothetical protein LBG80_05110 [Bacteroidales bacterium]|nr:hypothetical protein [Bacteroidales bacterium]
MTCHPYGILLTATIFSTDISSLRDFLNATEINAGIACSDRANEVEPRPNEEIRFFIFCSFWRLAPLLSASLRVRGKPAMTALIRRFRGCVKSTPVTTEVVIARSAATWQSLTINAFWGRD